jgi:hypothetical protein
MAQMSALIGLHPSPEASGQGFDPVVAGFTPGTVPTLFGGQGTVNMTTDRSQEANVPWSGAPGGFLRKLTHFRAPGMGDAMWSGACVYDMAGVSESISEYDYPDSVSGPTTADGDNYVDETVVNRGTVIRRVQIPVAEYSTTRRARVAAQFDSAPAARHFQGYWNPHWSGLMAGFVKTTPRPLFNNFNPNQMGSKELHRATQYNPVPPMGSLVGYFGTETKAL